MNWEAIARAGYEVYRMKVIEFGVKPWDGLDPQQRLAWIAAAQEICDIQARVALA